MAVSRRFAAIGVTAGLIGGGAVGLGVVRYGGSDCGLPGGFEAGQKISFLPGEFSVNDEDGSRIEVNAPIVDGELYANIGDVTFSGTFGRDVLEFVAKRQEGGDGLQSGGDSSLALDEETAPLDADIGWLKLEDEGRTNNIVAIRDSLLNGTVVDAADCLNGGIEIRMNDGTTRTVGDYYVTEG